MLEGGKFPLRLDTIRLDRSWISLSAELRLSPIKPAPTEGLAPGIFYKTTAPDVNSGVANGAHADRSELQRRIRV